MDEFDTVDARLQSLLAKRGEELIKALIEEFASLNRELAGLKRELAALAEYRDSRDRWLALEDAETGIARLPRLVVIEPDQLLRPNDGFYGIEHTSGGTPFRWTGPSPQFSFDVFIDRSHGAEVRLDVLNCIDFEVQKNLVLMADGESVPVSITPGTVGFGVAARLPARTSDMGTNLVFILPAVLTPPDSSDLRPLGLAFGRLTVTANNIETDPSERNVAAAEPAASRMQVDYDEDLFGVDDADTAGAAAT